MRSAWRRSARGPRFALVLGEAGIGKTRLVEELLHWAQRRGIECAYARCYAAEGELAYAPVSVLLRARPLPALDDVWLSEVARLLPEVLGERPDLPAPQPMTERWQRLRLFEALARAVLREGQPTLLVIDDLHWCDPETLDWLHFLLRFDVRARLLVVGTCRPEELDEDCPFAAALPVLHRDVRLTEIKVGPLNNEETAALASNVAREELDPAAAGNLYRETEGNPLFVVETVRAALRSEGRGLILGDGELEDGQPALRERGLAPTGAGGAGHAPGAALASGPRAGWAGGHHRPGFYRPRAAGGGQRGRGCPGARAGRTVAAAHRARAGRRRLRLFPRQAAGGGLRRLEPGPAQIAPPPGGPGPGDHLRLGPGCRRPAAGGPL